ncbi:hypothetical protein D515_01636 [Grimontia indica]|uniref:Lipoprotein n=1 Tax=Grimontia indica TaxID=1056512 RepID=R1H020_9GAMM|nr:MULTISPECIES: hypothetical protein [Grimontia]EOD81729.1 hypothetical protein D515_01636 [Grimontia indica]
MPDRLIKGLLGLAAFFIVVNLVAACDSEKYTHKVSYAEQVEALLVQEDITKQR